jgi:hypothetical protein
MTIDGTADLVSEPVHHNAPALLPPEIDLVDLEGHVGQDDFGGCGQIRCPEDDDPVLVRCIVQGEDMGLAVDDHRESANVALSEQLQALLAALKLSTMIPPPWDRLSCEILLAGAGRCSKARIRHDQSLLAYEPIPIESILALGSRDDPNVSVQ